jgi:sporulation protein YlmC with PRC-barrel domain
MKMKTKNVFAATAAAIILTTGTFAIAQETTPRATERMTPPAAAPSDQTAALEPGTLHEIKSDTATAQALNINAKDLAGMDIYGTDGKKIGDVDKVLGDNSNMIKAVTVDVGGFLGVGAREVVLPIDRLQKGTEKDRLQVSMSKSDIEKLKQWEKKK